MEQLPGSVGSPRCSSRRRARASSSSTSTLPKATRSPRRFFAAGPSEGEAVRKACEDIVAFWHKIRAEDLSALLQVQKGLSSMESSRGGSGFRPIERRSSGTSSGTSSACASRPDPLLKPRDADDTGVLAFVAQPVRFASSRVATATRAPPPPKLNSKSTAMVFALLITTPPRGALAPGWSGRGGGAPGARAEAPRLPAALPSAPPFRPRLASGSTD